MASRPLLADSYRGLSVSSPSLAAWSVPPASLLARLAGGPEGVLTGGGARRCWPRGRAGWEEVPQQPASLHNPRASA